MTTLKVNTIESAPEESKTSLESIGKSIWNATRFAWRFSFIA